jgi:hypothetical protein
MRTCKKCGDSKHMKRITEHRDGKDFMCVVDERWRVCYKCEPTLKNYGERYSFDNDEEYYNVNTPVVSNRFE